MAMQWFAGLMTGTVLDGQIDIALLRTDGAQVAEFGAYELVPYREEICEILRQCVDAARLWNFNGPDPEIFNRAERALTLAQADAVKQIVAKANLELHDIAAVGFHGQTVLHQPEAGITVQIGDPQLLARAADCAVVGQFRLADIANGGQGAPLAPLFHAARAKSQSGSLGVLNIGGVANITFLDECDKICAFDTGPGNALLDDWVSAKTGRPYDADGALARNGRVDEMALQRLLSHVFFDRAPPKSLDRLAFDPSPVARLSPEDGAATLTAFTAAAVARGLEIAGYEPARLIVCGGGRHNLALMEALQKQTGVAVQNCDALGWAGDALEAEAFAWLAVRHCLGLPTSVPQTTGVSSPIVGGRKYNP
mgnify:CR=1 FL=1